MKISLSNVRFFMFNNLEPLLDITSAATLFVAGVSRFSCHGMIEMGAHSIAGIFLFCNFLNSLLPFQHLAAMIITLFNMLFGDVTAFLIVFVVVLSGFSFAVDHLTSGSQESGAFTRLIYVALGDGISGVADLAQTSMLPGQVRSILMVWVILCNILLLNFLIAMMGDTFNKRKDTYEIWIFPFAKKVLLYEKNLYKRKSYDMRCKQNPKQAAYRFGQSCLAEAEESAASRFYNISHTNLENGVTADAHCTIFSLSETKRWSSLRELVRLGLPKYLQRSATNRIHTSD
mmetsp:Transcript_9168/g.19703  ORF Transcript_9168/g.19703 Transcript_9168/m.19703 type:complete len:288 (+) Transcript_9168:2285-3148(+)